MTKFVSICNKHWEDPALEKTKETGTEASVESNVTVFDPHNPCMHEVKVVMLDGAERTQVLNGFQIWVLIAKLKDDQLRTRTSSWLINGQHYDIIPKQPDAYKTHFRFYQRFENDTVEKISHLFKKNRAKALLKDMFQPIPISTE